MKIFLLRIYTSTFLVLILVVASIVHLLSLLLVLTHIKCFPPKVTSAYSCITALIISIIVVLLRNISIYRILLCNIWIVEVIWSCSKLLICNPILLLCWVCAILLHLSCSRVIKTCLLIITFERTVNAISTICSLAVTSEGTFLIKCIYKFLSILSS
jgi:hypothetical protein